jgi:hypothetical protein
VEHVAEHEGVRPQGYVLHCYEGGHCNWRWTPEPGGSHPYPVTKF